MIRRLSAPLLALILSSFALFGCDLLGDEPESPSVSTGVYVANAGGFGNQNSSLTIYNPSTQQAQRLPATGAGFTSYIQSLALDDNRVYLLFGETNSIGVFDPENTEPIAQITNVRNPRYMALQQNMAYVSGQDYRASPAPKLYQINRSTNEVVDSVEVGGTPEDVAVHDARVFVALGGQDGSVAVVDPTDMSVARTLSVDCDAPRSLAVDQQNELLVFCSGSTIYNNDFEVVDRTNGAIQVVDLASTEITGRTPLDTMMTSASQGQRVYYSAQTNEAFAVLADQTVLRFDATGNEITARFSADGAPIGAIAYDAGRQRLYIGRGAESNLFSAEGTVTVHRRDGTQVGSFDAGVAPTYIDVRRVEE